MKVFVLFGQRECRYPGEFATEALVCMDECGNSENPDYLIEEQEKYEQSGDFDRLAVVCLEVKSSSIEAALYPERIAYPAEVVEHG